MKKKSFPFVITLREDFLLSQQKVFLQKCGRSCLAVSETALKNRLNANLRCLAGPPGGWRLQQNPQTSTLKIKQNPGMTVFQARPRYSCVGSVVTSDGKRLMTLSLENEYSREDAKLAYLV